MKKVFGRGINIAAQIDNSRKNYDKFVEIKALDQLEIKNIACGFMQSYYHLADNQVIKAGYLLDTVISVRAFNYYRLFTWAFKAIQSLPYTSTFAFKGGHQELTLLNKDMVLSGLNIKKSVFNQAGIHLIDQGGSMHVLGQNYFGQRATGDNITRQSQFYRIDELKGLLDNKTEITRKISDCALGFQHTILISEHGEAFGCGKAIDYQIQPYKYHHRNEAQTLEKIEKPQLIYNKRKVKKAACGFKHSILVTEDNRVLSLGDNKMGQCGINYLEQPQISKIQQIYFSLRKGEEIIDVKCGFNHSWILTNMHLYFSGALMHNQNPLLKFQQNIAAFTVVNLPNDEQPIKIFTSFDRSAIISDKGKAYFFGGRDYSKKGGESGKLQVLTDFQFNKNSLIGLGFSHTIIAP